MPADAVPSSSDLAESRVDALTGVLEVVLVAGLRRGDSECMAGLFRAYFAPLVSFTRRYVDSVDEAEEVIAALFARLWERRATWTPRYTIESYLFAAARNAALNVRRTAEREARRNEAALEDASPVVRGAILAPDIDTFDEELAAATMRATVAQALVQLSDSGRVILELRWGRQMSYEAIAEVLRSTPAAVQRQHSRLLARLRILVERADA